MPDLFDTVEIEDAPAKDLFDTVELDTPAGDLFDTVELDDVPRGTSVEQKAAPGDARRRIEETIKARGMFPSLTDALTTAKEKRLVRNEKGEWETPALVSRREDEGFVESLVQGVTGSAMSAMGRLGAQSSVLSEDLNQIQQETGLSDEQMQSAWDDLGNTYRTFEEGEKLRVNSDGTLIPNAEDSDWLDTAKATALVEGSTASPESKARTIAALPQIQNTIASEKAAAYEAASSVVSSAKIPAAMAGIPTKGFASPTEWAAEKGRTDVGTPAFVRDYEKDVIDSASWAEKKAWGLAGKGVLSGNKVATTLLGITGMAGSDAAGELAAAGSAAGQQINQGLPETGLVGAAVEESMSIGLQIATGRLFGVAGAAAATSGTFAAAGAQSAGMTYADELAQGTPEAEAREKAAKAGVTTAVVTSIFGTGKAGGVERAAAGTMEQGTLRVLLQTAKQEGVKNVLRSPGLRALAKDVLVAAGGEAAEEGIDQLLQAFITADPDTDLSDAWSQAVEAAKTGAFIGGSVDVGMRIATDLAVEAMPDAPESGAAALEDPEEATLPTTDETAPLEEAPAPEGVAGDARLSGEPVVPEPVGQEAPIEGVGMDRTAANAPAAGANADVPVIPPTDETTPVSPEPAAPPATPAAEEAPVPAAPADAVGGVTAAETRADTLIERAAAGDTDANFELRDLVRPSKPEDIPAARRALARLYPELVGEVPAPPRSNEFTHSIWQFLHGRDETPRVAFNDFTQRIRDAQAQTTPVQGQTETSQPVGAEAATPVQDKTATPVPYSPEALKDTFDLSPEQSVAVDALVQAMGLDTSRIQLKRGGVPGAGAMAQNQTDSDYMAAVERGDMEAAQAMVDEAARAAGYDEKVFHGTDMTFDVFSVSGSGELGPGIYTTTDRGDAQAYAEGKLVGDEDDGTPRVIEGFARATNPVRLREANDYTDQLRAQGFDLESNAWRDVHREAKNLGFDSIELSFADGQKNLVLFSPNQIKSADPVTRRSDGSVIPLSERFNMDSPSILYSGNAQDAKGSFEQLPGTGDILLRGLTNPDVSTAVHELAHAARRTILNREVPAENRAGITDEDIAITEEWAGATGGDWTVDAEEKFARGLERYLRDGQAPVAALQGVFDKIGEWLRKIYTTVTGGPLDVKISPEMRAVFDKLVTRNIEAAPSEPVEPQAPDAGVSNDTQQLVTLDAQIEQDLEPPIPEPDFNAPQAAPGQSPTGIKHAVVDADRERLGLPPRFRPNAYTDQAAWDRAIAAEDAHRGPGTAGSKLLEKLIREGPRALTKDESALLLHEKLLREDAVDNAQAALNRAGADGRQELQAAVKAALEQFTMLADYMDAAGSKSGLSLQARKMMVNRDYSLASVAREMHAAKNLNAKEPVPWTDADQAKAAEVAKKLQETQARLDQVTEENTELTAAVERLTRDVEQAQAKLGVQVRETRLRKLVKEKLDPLAAEAKARLQARGKVRPSQNPPSAGPPLMQRPDPRDAEYLTAVERGDMEAAQAMVDEAANEAGFDTYGFHGSPDGRFDVFNPTEADDFPILGTSITFDRATSGRYANDADGRQGVAPNPKVFEVYTRGRTIEITDLRSRWEATGRTWANANPSEVTQFASDLGYSMVDPTGSGLGERSERIVIDPSQIKSADPVTRDAAGKIIPLSQRFNPESPSIFYSGLPPEVAQDIKDMAIVTAAWFADKTLTVAEFGAKLVSTFGDWAKDHIDAVFSQSQSLFTETAASVSGGNAPTPEQVRDSIDPETELTKQDVWELARAHVIAGARGRNVLENVFNDLSPLFPELTRDRVAELFTDYGKTSRPSDKPVAQELQRVKSLERIALKLADVRAGRMPKRTGFQRGEQDAEIRELEKQFREEYRALEEDMRAKGIPFEDSERRLKTALGAVKRRMLNEIEEIERAIASGEARNAAVRQPVQYDQEAIDLRARLEAKRAEYDAAFSKETTREKRVTAAIKTLDRQIAEEEKMLADGVLKKAKGEQVTSPEIETRREKLRQMRQNRRDLYAAQNPDKIEADALAAAKKAAQAAIERLGAAVASGDVAVKKKDPAYTPDAELLALIEARETLSDMVAEMRRALPATPEQEAAREKRMLAAAEATLRDLDAKLAAGDLSVKAPKGAASVPASVVAVREKIKAANRQLDARRREAGVGPYSMDAKIQRQLGNVNKRLAEYQRRIREQDFSKKVAVKPVTSAEILDAEFEAAKAKAEYQEMLNEFKLKNATFGKKAGYYLLSTNNLLKLLTLGFDIGVLTRQLGTTYQSIVRDMGMFAPTAEGARLRAKGSYVLGTLRAGAQAFMDPKRELDIYKAVSTRPNAGWDKAAGLVFGAPFDDQAGTREDVPTANFIETIPWWVWPAIAGAKVALVGVSPPVAALLIGTSLVQKRLLIALDRAQRAMTNQSRALWFDHAMENLPETMQNAESAKVLGTAIMVGTGRGVLPKSMEGMVPAANMILLATRFYISRIQSLLYGIRTAADVGTGFLATPKATKAARQEVAKMYARSVTGRALLLMLAAWGFGKSLGGDDEEDEGVVLDPFNPDFGRVKLTDKTKLDFMSGINGFGGVMVRIAAKQRTNKDTGRKEALSPTDLSREVVNFFASKRNLQVSFFWNTLRGEYYGGKAVNFQNGLEEATTAIIINDTVNAFKELGPVKGAALTMLMLTGAGTSVGDSEEEKNEMATDRKQSNLDRKRREAGLNQ